jgi:putative sterol carrier protein
MPTLKEIFADMPKSFQRDAAGGLSAVICFDLTGEGGGVWCATINSGELQIAEGAGEAPNLTITSSAQDYIDISTGALNEQLAFMTGRLKAKGDMGLAMKLPRIFKRAKPT